MTDSEALRAVYFRLNNLVNYAAQENDIRLREYNNQLYMHNVRKVEPEVNKRKNIPTKIVASLIDNEDGLSTQKLIEELQGAVAVEHEPIHLQVSGLNDEEMQRNHMVFMSLVDRAKRDGHKRIERLKESYEQVTAHQKQIMRQAVDDYKQHRGYHRLENRILELDNQLSKQRTLYAERKYQYDIRKAESTQSAEELRAKYEAETEELIRTLLQTIEKKQLELEVFQGRHEDIRRDIDHICKDLSVVLHDIEKEEKLKIGKRNNRKTQFSLRNKPDGYLDDSDSESGPTRQVKKEADEVTIMDVFPFIKVGELTDDMIQKSYALVDESASILQGKQAEKEYAEQKLSMKKNELTAILKSEESKALDRLKKMVIGLETKIDSDEKRAALLESLVKNLEQDSKAGNSGSRSSNKGSFAKLQQDKDKDSQKAASTNLSNRRSRNLAYGGSGSNKAATSSSKESSPAREFETGRQKIDDASSESENDVEFDDEEDDIDTGGNPAEIERKRVRKLERQARKRMIEAKKAKGGVDSSLTVVSEGSHSLSFGTNDSTNFAALQAKFLHGGKTVPSSMRVPTTIVTGKLTSPSNAHTRRETEIAVANAELISERFIAPSQLSKILKTMDAFEHYSRPPVWALGQANVLVPFSQRPILPQPTSNVDVVTTAASNVPFANSSRKNMRESGPMEYNKQERGPVAALGIKIMGKVPAPPSNGLPHASRSKTPSTPSRLIIEAHAVEGGTHQPPVFARTLTQKLEDQLLTATKENRDRLMSREEKAKLEEEKQQQDYFMQSFGFHLALDQLQMLMELLTHWGGTAPEQTTIDNLKEVLSPANGTMNIMMGVMKVRTEEEELEDLERMRHQTQEVLLSLKQAYRQNKSLHIMLKDTSKVVQNEVRRCDEVKRKLFNEIQGLHWEQHLQPGQYQHEMKVLKEKIQELKGELQMWETKIRQQGKSNNRMSQALMDETTARKISEGIADKVRQQIASQQKIQQHQLGMSSLSSVTGRSVLNEGSTVSENRKFAPRMSGGAGGNVREMQNKSIASISANVSAASSSILEELSDLDDTFDSKWSISSFGQVVDTKQSRSQSKKSKVPASSSIASVIEEVDIVSPGFSSKTGRHKRRRQSDKSALTGHFRNDDHEDSFLQRGSVALEGDHHDGQSHHQHHHSRSGQKKTKHQHHTRKRLSSHEDHSNELQKDEHDKLRLYHDATDIYAQAMRDLSESQKFK